jgi:hypothetical protein
VRPSDVANASVRLQEALLQARKPIDEVDLSNPGALLSGLLVRDSCEVVARLFGPVDVCPSLPPSALNVASSMNTVAAPHIQRSSEFRLGAIVGKFYTMSDALCLLFDSLLL